MGPAELSPAALALLAALPRELDPLERVARLRAALPEAEARAAAELHDARERARGRLADADRLLLTRKGAEQATDRRVADARAARIAAAARGRAVWDATAGVGGDALALAAAGLVVVALEREPRTLACLAANLAGAPRALAVRADTLAPPALDPRDALLVLDPDRRAAAPDPDARRHGDPARWSPPLAAALALARRFAGACIKLPPALDPERVAPLRSEAASASRGGARGALWSWTSLDGELKELALWLGDLAPEDERREALVLARGGAAARLAGGAERTPDEPALAAEEARAVEWILDPDPAVVAAGLHGDLARASGTRPLSAGLAYLGLRGDPPAPTPFARAFRVLGSAALDRKRVRRLLADHDVGAVTVKKRGHPDSAEVLARRLRGQGSHRGLVLVARLQRGHHAFLVEPSRAAHG